MINEKYPDANKMIIIRYYLLVTMAVIAFWWPLRYLLSRFLYKRRVSRLTQNIPSMDDFPFLGCALRFMGKNNEGIINFSNSYLQFLESKINKKYQIENFD